MSAACSCSGWPPALHIHVVLLSSLRDYAASIIIILHTAFHLSYLSPPEHVQ